MRVPGHLTSKCGHKNSRTKPPDSGPMCYASSSLSAGRHSRRTLAAGMPGQSASTLRSCWRRDAYRGGRSRSRQLPRMAVTDGGGRPDMRRASNRLIWPPFAVGAMAALRMPNCDYAARPGDALRIAVALVPVSDAAGRRVPARTGRRDHCRRTPPLAAAVVAAGPSAGQTAGPTARSRCRGLPARRGCLAGKHSGVSDTDASA